jgi:isopentenyl diphosphate isomerase/L-lactate dehydrogenase-like FMN-dependent dehydrogenase
VRAPTFFQAYGQWMQSALPTWEDVQWLREQWDGPFMVKGITRVDDARRAAEIGATAISVSNHGVTTWTAPRAPSGCSRLSPRLSATSSRSCWMAACAGAATW